MQFIRVCPEYYGSVSLICPRVGAHIVGAASSPLPFRFLCGVLQSAALCMQLLLSTFRICVPQCSSGPAHLCAFVSVLPPCAMQFWFCWLCWHDPLCEPANTTPPSVASAISCHILREIRKSCQLVCLVTVMVNLRPWIFKTLRPFSLVCITCASTEWSYCCVRIGCYCALQYMFCQAVSKSSTQRIGTHQRPAALCSLPLLLDLSPSQAVMCSFT